MAPLCGAKYPNAVMAGLVPAIHAVQPPEAFAMFVCAAADVGRDARVEGAVRTIDPEARPSSHRRLDYRVDGRDKPGHDGEGARAKSLRMAGLRSGGEVSAVAAATAGVRVGWGRLADADEGDAAGEGESQKGEGDQLAHGGAP